MFISSLISHTHTHTHTHTHIYIYIYIKKKNSNEIMVGTRISGSHPLPAQ